MAFAKLVLSLGEIERLVASHLGCFFDQPDLAVEEDGVSTTDAIFDEDGELESLEFEIDLNLIEGKANGDGTT